MCDSQHARVREVAGFGPARGRSNLRAFTDEHKHFWLEQNASKASKWANLAREGHD